MISEGSCDTEAWSNDAEKSQEFLHNIAVFSVFLSVYLSINVYF